MKTMTTRVVALAGALTLALGAAACSKAETQVMPGTLSNGTWTSYHRRTEQALSRPSHRRAGRR